MSKEISKHVGFMGEFMVNLNALTAALLKDLRNKYKISNEQSSVLLMLSHDRALTLTEITLRQGVNKAAVSRRVKKLVELKLVEWVQLEYSYDKRLKYIALTDHGTDYVRESRHIIDNLASEMLSDIAIDQIEQTREVLEQIDQRVKSHLKKM